jgi:phage tail-like protein
VAEFIPFRFKVVLYSAERAGGGSGSAADRGGDSAPGEILCGGYFSEVSGLELNMEPRSIREGGHNWGEHQRSGPTKFATVVLKRGVTSVNDLWSWFDVTTRGANYGYRLIGEIEVMGNPSTQVDKPGAPVRSVAPSTVLRWRLSNVLPVKFKGPDLSATASQVAIEELHLVHEGLELERP